MYKKKISDKFKKDGYKVSLLDIDYKDVSICLVDIEDARKTYCKIKNSPIYYYIVEGKGEFLIGEEITVEKGDLIEITANKKYTYKGNMKMLEIIPNSFEKLEVEEENIDIPESVLEYGFDFDWDEKDVWKLDYPSQTIDIKELEWHFSVPFWDWENSNYNLTPNQVMRDKEKYKEQYDRIMNSDIEYPIDIMENKGKYVILDGLHRLVKCKLLGNPKVNVRIIPRTEIPNISK